MFKYKVHFSEKLAIMNKYQYGSEKEARNGAWLVGTISFRRHRRGKATEIECILKSLELVA